MKTPFATLALACLATLCSVSAQAQGLRSSGSRSSTGPGLQAPAPVRSAPASTSTSTSTSVQQADYIVAVVNSEPITNHQVRQRLLRAEQQMAEQGGTPPPQLAQQVLELMIGERALQNYAREGGIKIDAAQLEQAEANIAQQNSLTVDEMHRRMQADGLSVEGFRTDLQRQLLLNRLREREVDAQVKVSDLEIDQFLREQPGQSTAPAAVEDAINLAHILLRVPEDATPEEIATLQTQAETLAAQARQGEDFAALARAHSSAPEAASGGLLGLRAADRYPTLFVEGVHGLDVGSIAGPLRSPAGFHILQVLERERADTPAPTVMVRQNHARHILLRTSAKLSEAAAVARLKAYQQRIQSGKADFAEMAQAHSQDASAKEGGDLGWSSPGMFVPEFEAALDGLQPGQISAPLVTRFGVHLVQLLERREAVLNLREQREAARGLLREKKIDEAMTTLLRDVRTRAYVELREAPQ